MHSTNDTDPLRVGVIVGSTRPGRTAPTVARWVLERAEQRAGLHAELVDVADYELPLLDEPQAAIHGHYEHAHTKAWAEAIASYDAYVFVTPEYNHAIPGALKNAIDYLYAEWKDKAAGLVSYGVDAGGARAAEQLRLVLGELNVADVRANVALSLFADFEDFTTVAPQPRSSQALDLLLDQLLAWGSALRTLRAPAAVPR